MRWALGAKSEEEDGDADGDGETDWAHGTGMGEGEGLRDVTNEIEDDKQLEGLQNETWGDEPEGDFAASSPGARGWCVAKYVAQEGRLA